MSVLKRQREQKKMERNETKAIRRRERRDGIESGAISSSSESSSADTTVEEESLDSEFGESTDGTSDDGRR
jgi:hypothetical protein